MGYRTEFYGQINIEPPLNAEEIAYLTKFSESRRMLCTQGPYYVDRGGSMGQSNGPDVLDYNHPPAGQPGLWCNWTPTADGKAIEWDGGENFYYADEWMAYLMAHFLAPDAYAKGELPFLQGHTCNGSIEAQGEDRDDAWLFEVVDNVVKGSRLVRVPDARTSRTISALPPETKLIGG